MVGDWAAANDAELACVPTNASWMNLIETQFQASRYFTLDGTDHHSHEEQNPMIRRYTAVAGDGLPELSIEMRWWAR